MSTFTLPFGVHHEIEARAAVHVDAQRARARIALRRDHGGDGGDLIDRVAALLGRGRGGSPMPMRGRDVVVTTSLALKVARTRRPLGRLRGGGRPGAGRRSAAACRRPRPLPLDGIAIVLARPSAAAAQPFISRVAAACRCRRSGVKRKRNRRPPRPGRGRCRLPQRPRLAAVCAVGGAGQGGQAKAARAAANDLMETQPVLDAYPGARRHLTPRL